MIGWKLNKIAFFGEVLHQTVFKTCNEHNWLLEIVSNSWGRCRKFHRWTWQASLNVSVVLCCDLCKSSPWTIFASRNSLCSALVSFFFKRVQGWPPARCCYFSYQSHFPSFIQTFPRVLPFTMKKESKDKAFSFLTYHPGDYMCLLSVKWESVASVS